MFEFKPIEARDVNWKLNRIIECWGNQAALMPLVDFLANEHQCGTHRSSSFPHESLFSSMSMNLRKKSEGNVVILVTDEEAKLPYYVKYGADLVLFGETSGSITVHKDRGGSLSSMFRCTGTSSPTGRTFDPSGPRLQNMKPTESVGVFGQARKSEGHNLGMAVTGREQFDVQDTSWRGYSMGAKVKEPECFMCDAGLPLKKSNIRFDTDAPASRVIMTHTFDGEMTLNDAQGREFIKINAEGEAFVRGEKVAAGQQDIYEMFRAWMQKTVGGLSQDRHTKMHDIPLPEAWKADAQGEVLTKECLDDLRKQVESHALPVRMFDIGPYDGPVWDAVAGNPCNETGLDSKPVITKTGHDITNAVRRQETASLINDVDSDPHISDSLRARLLAALKVR